MKYKFIITSQTEKTVEADSAEEARYKLINRRIQVGEGSPEDIIDDGILVEENLVK